MVLLFICANQTYSQNFEVGPYAGGANFIGDVGSTTYINPNTGVFGGIFKWNRSHRHTLRFSFLHAGIEAHDKNSNDTRRQERGYSFSNSITEASVGLEFTFWNWDLHSDKNQSTPYLYTGINYYFADELILKNEAYTNSRTNYLVKAGNSSGFSIPMVLGYKKTLNGLWAAGIEIGARYTFTDNLDGSQPSELEGRLVSRDFGNSNTTDWYVFTGVYLTLNFGPKSCYNEY